MPFELEHLDPYRHRIPRDTDLGMRTGVMVYAGAALLKQIEKDQSLQQAVNVAALPGIVGDSLAMPDIHQGYGFPIGGVAATDLDAASFPQAVSASTSTVASALPSPPCSATTSSRKRRRSSTRSFAMSPQAPAATDVSNSTRSS